MISLNGVFSISTQKEFNTVLIDLIANPTKRSNAGNSNSNYTKENKGALNKIITYLGLN